MIVSKAFISSASAMALVQGAVAHAVSKDWGVCVAVVDPGGAALALWRMDDVSVAVIDFALDKAYTCAVMKRSTQGLFERTEESTAMRFQLANRPRMMVWGGGLPIYHEGQLVGGIGVSGAKDFEDIECCKVALAAVGLGFEA